MKRDKRDKNTPSRKYLQKSLKGKKKVIFRELKATAAGSKSAKKNA